MNSHSSGRRSRRWYGGSRHRRDGRGRQHDARSKAPIKRTFWQRLAAFFGGNGKSRRKTSDNFDHARGRAAVAFGAQT